MKRAHKGVAVEKDVVRPAHHEVETPRGRPQGHGRVFWFALAVMAVVSAWFAISWVTWQDKNPSALGAQVPKKLGGLALLRWETGPEALASVDKMHAGSFSLRDAFVAVYERDATVWVGEAESEAGAEGLLKAMVSAIGRGGSPFSSPSQVTVNGAPMFSTTDSRQQHLFYRIGKRVVWVAAPSQDGTRFVQDVDAFLR